MKTNRFEKYSSKVNPLYIPLPGFQFFHGSSSEDDVDRKFIGRRTNIERLKSWLTDSTTRTGVYLVTGFRGMGKSSFVGKVLSKINEEEKKNGKKKTIPIKLNLGHETLNERDILSLISNSIEYEYIRYLSKYIKKLEFIKWILVLLPFIILTIKINLNLNFGW